MPLERIAPELPGEVTGLVKQMLTRDLGRRTASLVDVSKTLGRYTNVRAPEFGVPSTGRGAVAATPKTMESAKSVRPNARIVASPGADPRGPTMLSSPPVNSSLQLEPAPVRSGRSVYFLGAVLVAVALGGWVWGATRPGPAAQSRDELPTLPQAPLAAAKPIEVAATAAGPSAVAPAPSAGATESPRKSAAAKLPKPRPQRAAPKPVTHVDPSEETLFSGPK